MLVDFIGEEDWDLTSQICKIGDDINELIFTLYSNESPDIELELQRRFGQRSEWWLSRPLDQLIERVKRGIDEYQRRVISCIESGDEFGLFRTNYWFEHGTLDILRHGNQKLREFQRNVPKLEELLEQSKQALDKLSEQDNPSVHVEKTLVIEGQNTLSKKHIFRINTSDRVLFTEAFEYVTGLQSEDTIRQSLCLPTAVGCAMACRMCDLGTFYGGELPKEAMLQMMERVMDVHTVGWKNPSHVKIAYLGGGEPAYNRDILEVLRIVSQKYPGCSQVVSTVGVDNNFNDKFTDLARDMNVGFQISVYSLDDSVRNYIINREKILSADQCLDVLGKYHTSTGRKGRMAVVLLEGMHLDKIEQQIKERVNKEAVHISLQTLSESSTGFPHRTLPLPQFETFRDGLENSGYSISIYNPPELEFRGSCGVASDNLLARITPYKKRLR